MAISMSCFLVTRIRPGMAPEPTSPLSKIATDPTRTGRRGTPTYFETMDCRSRSMKSTTRRVAVMTLRT
jgi:hypothetical protein